LKGPKSRERGTNKLEGREAGSRTNAVATAASYDGKEGFAMDGALPCALTVTDGEC
jgi:hypothetical protein